MKVVLTYLLATLLFAVLSAANAYGQANQVKPHRKPPTSINRPDKSKPPKKPTGTATTPARPTPPKVNILSQADEVITVNGVSFGMMKVQGGTFTMGATSEQGSDAESAEKPAHQVTLSTFSIGQTEVTQELWQAVMGGNPSYFKGAKRPVEQVSWEDGAKLPICYGGCACSTVTVFQRHPFGLCSSAFVARRLNKVQRA